MGDARNRCLRDVNNALQHLDEVRQALGKARRNTFAGLALGVTGAVLGGGMLSRGTNIAIRVVGGAGLAASALMTIADCKNLQVILQLFSELDCFSDFLLESRSFVTARANGEGVSESELALLTELVIRLQAQMPRR